MIDRKYYYWYLPGRLEHIIGRGVTNWWKKFALVLLHCLTLYTEQLSLGTATRITCCQGPVIVFIHSSVVCSLESVCHVTPPVFSTHWPHDPSHFAGLRKYCKRVKHSMQATGRIKRKLVPLHASNKCCVACTSPHSRYSTQRLDRCYHR